MWFIGEKADSSSEEAAFPQEAPTIPSQHWGGRLARRIREKLQWIPRGACLKGGAEVTQPLPDWRDLPEVLRLRVQQQTPERQALWEELRDSSDDPDEFLDLLRIRIDNDDIVAAVASALHAALSSE